MTLETDYRCCDALNGATKDTNRERPVKDVLSISC